MNWFPQIGTGSVAQFPLRRKRQWRAIANGMESGEMIALPDANGGSIQWNLSYRELTDAEVAKISGLFSTTNGDAGSFGFVDPFANLFGWSEDLSKPDWQLGLLTLTPNMSDPVGTQRACGLQNTAAGEQMLTQTLGIPGDYTACFSVYVRGDSAGTIGIVRDSQRLDLPVGPQWKRIRISGLGVSGAPTSTFSLAVPSGMTVRVFGLQAEAQPWASPYRPTGTAAGILEETRFADGGLTIASTAPGQSACQITLVSRTNT